MKIQVLNNKGEKTGDITLNKALVNSNVSSDLLVQYVRAYLFNKRQGTSKVKTRAEVSGSGAKPWKQKGTGRARVGSKRTPIWRHGGIVHGPKPKDWSLSLNSHVKKNALIGAINLAIASEILVVMHDLDFITNKTKDTLNSLKQLDMGRKLLIISDKIEESLRLGTRNIKNITLADSNRLNAYQILDAGKILISKKGLENLEKRLFDKLTTKAK